VAANAGERPLSFQWLRDVVHVWVDLFEEHDVLTYATAIAFRLLIALVPLTLFSLALLGALGEQHVWDKTMAPAVSGAVRPPVFYAINSSVHKIFTSPVAPLVALGIVLSIWDVSGAVRASIGALNRAYDTDEKRSTVDRFGVSVAIAIGLIVLIVGALLVILAAPNLAPHGALRWPLAVVRWPIAIVMLGAAVALLVRFGPADPPKARWATAGGALVVAVWIVASLIFRWYVASVANFRSAEGVLVAILVLTTYLYVSSIIFLVGVHLDEQLRRSARKSSSVRGTLRTLSRGG
jgi:membrane protein